MDLPNFLPDWITSSPPAPAEIANAIVNGAVPPNELRAQYPGVESNAMPKTRPANLELKIRPAKYTTTVINNPEAIALEM